ncbi:MAG: lipid A deacylase LpxR family protein [Pseudomonadota bacterium]
MGDEHLGAALRRGTRLIVCTLMAAFFGALKVAAAGEPLPRDLGTWTHTVENDWFGGQDRNYTNGTRYAYVTRAVEPMAWEQRLIRDPERSKTFRRGFAFAQTLHTPDNIRTPTPAEDDHPYAGYMFIEYALMTEDQGVVDILTLEAGVVGPWALGEEIQTWYHGVIAGDDPLGWDAQHPNEVVANLSFDRKGRALFTAKAGWLGLDLTPSYGVTLGTVNINARAGGMVRLGNRLGSDFGPARIRPSLTGSGHFDYVQPAAWYVFFGAQARAVAHDLTLNGSLFRDDGPSVERNTWVGDLQYGYAVQLGRIQLAWTSVKRTERFATQDGPDRFGAISLSVKF